MKTGKVGLIAREVCLRLTIAGSGIPHVEAARCNMAATIANLTFCFLFAIAIAIVEAFVWC